MARMWKHRMMTRDKISQRNLTSSLFWHYYSGRIEVVNNWSWFWEFSTMTLNVSSEASLRSEW